MKQLKPTSKPTKSSSATKRKFVMPKSMKAGEGLSITQTTPTLPLVAPKMIRIRPTTPAEKKTLHPYSNSRLVSLNTCPIWGVVSAQKKYATGARSMALEAGKVMHDVFAAVRIWQLEHRQNLPRHAEATAHRIFGKNRWKDCVSHIASKDERAELLQLCFNVLHTSGWEDYEKDKNRTMANLELSSIDYVDERLQHMDNWPIYVENGRDPYCMVGIEQTFDVVAEFEDGSTIRYIGTVDGLVVKEPEGVYCLDENKSANRLGDGWRAGFEMSHQITGYCAAGSVIFGFPVQHSRVTGVKIGRGEDPYTLEPIARDEEFVAVWASWLYHSAKMFEAYKDNYEAAPRYTHSCNRYFRPCSLIPFCSDTVAGRKEQWAQMVPNDLSPSEEAILGG